MKTKLTAIVNKEEDMYVSFCPEYDIASQGFSIEEAISMLKEAVELFLEDADDSEIRSRYKSPIIVSQMEINNAKAG